MLILSETENIFLVSCIHCYHLPGEAFPAEDATQGRGEHPSCDTTCMPEQPPGTPLPSSTETRRDAQLPATKPATASSQSCV